MKELLHSIFGNINDWLKFAEAKNAAFLALDGATLFFLIQFLRGESNLPILLALYLWELIIFLAAAVVILLLSFIPITRIPRLAAMSRESHSKNLLFFGDIADCDPKEYLDMLSELYNVDYDKKSKLLHDYAEQVVVNARISLQKYIAFKSGAWLVLCGVFTPILAVVLYILRKR